MATPGTPCWFDLMTPDPEAAAAFYAQVLGWGYTPDSGPEMGNYRMALARGKVAAGLGTTQEGMPAVWSVYFATPDVDAFAARVEALGGKVIDAPMNVGDAGRMAIFSDPTGSVFGAWQAGQHAGAEIVDVHGAMCWCEVNTWRSKEAAAFFGELLGARVEKMEGMEYYTLAVGPEPECGVLQMTAEWDGMQPAWMVYFAVDSADAAAKAIDAAGGKVMHGPFDTPHGRLVVSMDPFGAPFSVMQPLAS